MQSFMAGGGVILVDPSQGWPATLQGGPGSYVVVFTDEQGSIEGRLAGLELRDTILVLSEGPASRYAFMFRIPLVEPTVADQMTRTRTGALNIQGCRVAGADSTRRQNKAEMGFHGGNLAATYATGSDAGRWPPNVLLVHGSGCVQGGTKKIKGRGGREAKPKVTGNTYAQDVYTKTRMTNSTVNHDGPDGMETITAWTCAATCPAKILDGQTGERPSTLTGRADPTMTHGNPGDNHGSSLFGGGNSHVYADSGGGSRFYPQFKDDEELFAWLQCLLATPV